MEQVKTILKTVKAHHWFTQGKWAKQQVLTRLLPEVGPLLVQTRPMVARLAQRPDRLTPRARAPLGAMHEVPWR